MFHNAKTPISLFVSSQIVLIRSIGMVLQSDYVLLAPQLSQAKVWCSDLITHSMTPLAPASGSPINVHAANQKSSQHRLAQLGADPLELCSCPAHLLPTSLPSSNSYTCRACLRQQPAHLHLHIHRRRNAYAHQLIAVSSLRRVASHSVLTSEAIYIEYLTTMADNGIKEGDQGTRIQSP